MRLLTQAALIVALAGLTVACKAETSSDGAEDTTSAPAADSTGNSAAPADAGTAAAATELRIAVEGMT